MQVRTYIMQVPTYLYLSRVVTNLVPLYIYILHYYYYFGNKKKKKNASLVKKFRLGLKGKRFYCSSHFLKIALISVSNISHHDLIFCHEAILRKMKLIQFTKVEQYEERHKIINRYINGKNNQVQVRIGIFLCSNLDMQVYRQC